MRFPQHIFSGIWMLWLGVVSASGLPSLIAWQFDGCKGAVQGFGLCGVSFAPAIRQGLQTVHTTGNCGTAQCDGLFRRAPTQVPGAFACPLLPTGLGCACMSRIKCVDPV